MTGGCFTRAKEVDAGNIVGGRTRGRLASSNNSKIVSSGQVNGGSIKGGSTATDGIRTRQKRVVPTRKACLQDCSFRVDGNLVNGQSKEDVKQIGDHTSKRVECSVSTSEPGVSSRNLPAVNKKNVVEVQSTRSVAVPKIIGVGNPSTRPVANSQKKEKSSDHVQALKIEAKSSPMNTSTARNSIKIGSENHHDKSPRTQHRTTTRLNGSSAPQRKTNEVEKNPHVAESSRNQKTISFLRRAETSRSGEKREKELNYNVVIDKDLLRQRAISEDSDNTLGISCPLCENDLMASSLNYEYHDGIEPSNLPEVAVLHCGHVFHSACLEEILPSGNCREPPCYFCISNKD
ncbi:hypothetical protein LIER_09169 [Lithospermum erythrorhizon]|uniref:RING-type domain-containing protein n=1 Tax=Lithospermum erythrorhizon TaxID=34254 RepID=A0AAV3PJ09_LITER